MWCCLIFVLRCKSCLCGVTDWNLHQHCSSDRLSIHQHRHAAKSQLREGSIVHLRLAQGSQRSQTNGGRPAQVRKMSGGRLKCLSGLVKLVQDLPGLTWQNFVRVSGRGAAAAASTRPSTATKSTFLVLKTVSTTTRWPTPSKTSREAKSLLSYI